MILRRLIGNWHLSSTQTRTEHLMPKMLFKRFQPHLPALATQRRGRFMMSMEQKMTSDRDTSTNSERISSTRTTFSRCFSVGADQACFSIREVSISTTIHNSLDDKDSNSTRQMEDHNSRLTQSCSCFNRCSLFLSFCC